MKHKNYTTLLTAIIAVFLFGSFAVMAQTAGNFTQDGASAVYTSTSGKGVIRMLNVGADFDATGAGGVPLGTATAIPGIVDWAAAANGQLVRNLQYTNLFASGGTKTIADGVTVSGGGFVDACPTWGDYGYDNFVGTGYGYYATSGDRTYIGTFFYDGDVAQTIFPESNSSAGNTNRYNLLDLSGTGAKTSPAGQVVYVNEDLTSASGTTLNVLGDMYINHGNAGAGSSIAGALNIGDASTEGDFYSNLGDVTVDGVTTITNGSFTVNNIGDVTFNANVTVGGGDGYNGLLASADNAGDINISNGITLAIVAGSGANPQPGQLNIGANNDLVITGAITNGVPCGQRTNLIFADGSTVTYNGATGQSVMGTNAAAVTGNHNYANLVIAGLGNKDAECDIYMREDLALQGTALLRMHSENGVIDPTSVTNNYTLFFDVADANNDVVYAVNDNSQFVRGKMQLYASTGNIPVGVDYTFNNPQTIVSFLAGSALTNFQLQIYPGIDINPTAATMQAIDFSATDDIDRFVRASWTGTGDISKLRVGYNNTQDFANGFDVTLEPKMKMFEGYNSASPKSKLTANGNITYTQSGATDPRYVELTGDAGIELVAAGNSALLNRDLANTANIILGWAPIQTIAHGRWSNPATWDEGTVPASDDDARVRHAVWTGIDQAFLGLPAYADDERDFSQTVTPDVGTGYAANSVEIIQAVPGTFDNPALIIGNNDATMSGLANAHVFMIGPGGVKNFNTNPPLATQDSELTASTQANGIWVMDQCNSGFVFRGVFFQNRGVITNNGLIEVGTP